MTFERMEEVARKAVWTGEMEDCPLPSSAGLGVRLGWHMDAEEILEVERFTGYENCTFAQKFFWMMDAKKRESDLVRRDL